MRRAREERRPDPDDREAFLRLYDETLPRVYGYFLHRCGGSVTTAEDLTQETYLAAARALGEGRFGDDPAAWLFGIARHLLLDHYRRQYRAADRLVEWQTEGLDDLPDPALDADDALDRWRVAEALAQLPSMQRAAVVLRHLDGWSVPEVASELGKSVHATESLLARGRIGLKRLLMDDDQPLG